VSYRILIDFEGREIRFTDERQAHIEFHSEMLGQTHRIIEALETPDRVVISDIDTYVRIYERFYEKTPVTRKYLLVAVKIRMQDAFVLTAFYSSKPKKGSVAWTK
jgi:hypothetical protein